MVTILAGPNKEPFLVHKDFACHYSPVLRAAFNSSFIEGETQTYDLDDVEEETVRLLVHWIYTQSIALDEGYSTGDGDSMSEKVHASSTLSLSKL